MLELIVWAIAGVAKALYMLYYHKRSNKKWGVLDTLAAIVINTVFYGMLVEMILKLID